MTGPSHSQVTGWIADIEKEIEAVRARITPLAEHEVALSERLAILQRLRASLEPDSESVGRIPGHAEVPAAAFEAYKPLRPSSTSVRDRVHAHAVNILSAENHTMHINNLFAEFIKRGYEVPGAGRPNNITAHLTGWEDIQSPTRGYYKAVTKPH